MCVVKALYIFWHVCCLLVFPVSWPGNPFAKKAVFFALSTTTSVQVKCLFCLQVFAVLSCTQGVIFAVGNK